LFAERESVSKHVLLHLWLLNSEFSQNRKFRRVIAYERDLWEQTILCCEINGQKHGTQLLAHFYEA
jgi:hypothetical protein